MNHSFMNYRRRIIFACLASFLMLFAFSGCGGSPEYVVSKFFEKLYDGDTVAAKRYCTQNFITKYGENLNQSSQSNDVSLLLLFYFLNTIQEMGQDIDRKPDKKDFAKENFDCVITGKTATVWVKEFTGLKITCANEKGIWKVDGFGFDSKFLFDIHKNLNINDLKDLTPEKLKDLAQPK